MGPAAGVRRPRTPLLVDRLADAEDLASPWQREALQELFRESRDAPEIGVRPLDIGVPRRQDALMYSRLPQCPDSFTGKCYSTMTRMVCQWDHVTQHVRDWTELKTLLTQRFQPRDLTAAYKAQFRTRKISLPTWMRYRS